MLREGAAGGASGENSVEIHRTDARAVSPFTAIKGLHPHILRKQFITRFMLQSRGDLRPDDYLILQSKYLRARASELKNIQTSAEQARAMGLIGDKPLIVLTAGRSFGSTPIPGLSPNDLVDSQRIWAEDLQPRLAHLSTHGKQITVPDSGHDIPAERPDVVVEAVRELCSSVAAH